MPDQSTSTAHGVTSFGFSDVRDYIEKITNAIWNGPDRDPELVRRYYGPATPIQTDNGDVIGAEQVTANTHARLRAFPVPRGPVPSGTGPVVSLRRAGEIRTPDLLTPSQAR